MNGTPSGGRDRVIAVGLGAAGVIGYVVFDGSRWWLWAQVALLPFVLLVVFTDVKPAQPGQPPPEPWHGGFQDGPWGPPWPWGGVLAGGLE